MKGGKYRVLMLCDRPIQYSTLLCQGRARHRRLDGYKWTTPSDKNGKRNGNKRPGFLVRDRETGCVYPCGDVVALARALRASFQDDSRLQRMAGAAKERLKPWTPEMNVSTIVSAVQIAPASRNNDRPAGNTQAIVTAEKQ